MKNGFFWDNSIIKKVSNFTRRYIYLQLEKPSGIESEMPNPEVLAMDWLKSGQKGPPLGSDRVKKGVIDGLNNVHVNVEWPLSHNRKQ